MRVLVTPSSFGADINSPAKELLNNNVDEIIYNPYSRPMTEQEILPLLDGIDGYLAGLDFITSKVIEKAPKSLKVISRYGVGYDRVDMQAAAKKGIIVTNTPGMNSQSVADLAMGLIIAAARRIPCLDSKVKHGVWPKSSGIELYQKTIGVIGLGAIGKGVAMRAKGFSMTVLAYDPYIDSAYVKANGIEEVTLDELFRRSDIISLHLPINEQTRNIINKDSIKIMKPETILINTSRGGLINEQDVYEALKSGKLGGLGLDAFEKEPPDSSPLFEMDNVVTTPHIGAHTHEAVNNMGILAVRNLLDVLAGKSCEFIVNQKLN
jgi:D-3-phosphoglycerate dehydrogenase